MEGIEKGRVEGRAEAAVTTIVGLIKDGILTIESGCSTNPVGEKSPTGFFTCKKEKSEL